MKASQNQTSNAAVSGMMFTEKQVNKVCNKVINSSKTLAGACKMFNNLFKSKKELVEICKELDVPMAIGVSLAEISKKKDCTLQACISTLPRVDNIFVKYVQYERVYKDINRKSENMRISEKAAEKIVAGKQHKPFGISTPVDIDGGNISGYYYKKESQDYIATYVAIRQDSFSVKLVAKCVICWLVNHQNK